MPSPLKGGTEIFTGRDFTAPASLRFLLKQVPNSNNSAPSFLDHQSIMLGQTR